MRRLVATLLAVLLVTAAVGCGGNVEKNKYKDLDRPKPASEQ